MPAPHDDDLDFCTCDIEIEDSEATPDEELPAASGGLDSIPETAGDLEETDGCEVGFTESDAVADEDLPTSAGGVG